MPCATERLKMVDAKRAAYFYAVPWPEFEKAARTVGALIPPFGCKVYATKKGAIVYWRVVGYAPDGSDVRDFMSRVEAWREAEFMPTNCRVCGAPGVVPAELLKGGAGYLCAPCAYMGAPVE